MKVFSRLLLAPIFVIASVASWAQDRFESQTAGFAFAKAEAWVFASVQQTQANREQVRLNDAEIERRLRTQAALPLAAVTRYPEPHPDLNASFQVSLRPLGALASTPPVELIDILLPSLGRAFEDFRVVSPATSTTVGGLPAARAGFQYTLKTGGGQEFPTRSEIIVVPRGAFMFLIGMGRKPDDREAEAAQEQMLASIQIQP